jgi:hypothetical protein
MTQENYDDAIAELARTAEMDAQTVAALERRLLQAFSEHHPAGTDAVRLKPRWTFSSHAWRRWGAAAAVFVILMGGMAGWRALRPGSPGVDVRQPPAPPAPPVATIAKSVPSVLPAVPMKPARRQRPAARVVRPEGFVALPGSAGLPAFESGTIVRLELSLASLPSYGVDITRAGTDRPVEADVLVGQDGQPRAIRLVSSDGARNSRSPQ